MSYDLWFMDRESQLVIVLSEKHHVAGGTYALGGTDRAEFNITYNYAPFYKVLWGDEGIRHLYGKTATEVIELLDAAIPMLLGDPKPDYWEACGGNARQALEKLRELAVLVPPEAVLTGD